MLYRQNAFVLLSPPAGMAACKIRKVRSASKYGYTTTTQVVPFGSTTITCIANLFYLLVKMEHVVCRWFVAVPSEIPAPLLTCNTVPSPPPWGARTPEVLVKEDHLIEIVHCLLHCDYPDADIPKQGPQSALVCAVDFVDDDECHESPQ